MMIDIKRVKESAQNKMNEERVKRFEDMLVRQMRIVDAAEQVLRAERLKLADIEQQIADGTA